MVKAVPILYAPNFVADAAPHRLSSRAVGPLRRASADNKEVIPMRLLRGPWLLSIAALGAVFGAQAVGCGGGNSTSQSGGTTGTGGTGGTTSTGGTAGSGGTAQVCGDGKIEGTERCDLGSANGSEMGCTSSCDFDCSADADCNKANNPCAGTATCVDATVQGQAVKQCMAGTPLAEGASCGTNLVCVNMNCVAPSCGDGVVETGEECDDGNTTAGDGCENDCKFTCLSTDPTRNCASTNPCISDGTCGASNTCTAGSPVTDGTACTGGTCQNGTCVASSCTGLAKCTVCSSGFCDGSGTCKASSCGDGCVDASKGEQCDPPNGTTCDATCKTVSGCGNGTLDPGEQCDDGNTFDLDGCDSSCKYEVVARMDNVAISGNQAPASMGCMPATNALGAKVLGGPTGLALSQLNSTLASSISGDATTAPTVNVMTQFLGLTDLTGTAASGFQIGVLDASLDSAKGTWPGNDPMDWWFLADGAAVSMGLPSGKFTTTSLAAHVLKGGPNNVTLDLNLGGSPAALTLLSAHINATIGTATNTPAAPPSKLANGTAVFETITGNGTGQGLCGNVTVASLAAIPVPSALTSGLAACSQGYIACDGQNGHTLPDGCNSLLDVLVSGCGTFLGNVVNPTQPDVAAGTSVKTLTPGSKHIIPSTQTSGDMDAYSAFLTFTAKREHFTGQTCSATIPCQTGKTCNASNVCQ